MTGPTRQQAPADVDVVPGPATATPPHPEAGDPPPATGWTPTTAAGAAQHPETAPVPASARRPWRPWRPYRRSLARRVGLLTTMAVALAVVVLAAGTYATARVQLQSQTDNSLLQRAKAAAASGVLTSVGGNSVTTANLGAADVGIVILRYDGESMTFDTTILRLGEPEYAVARGERPQSVRTITADGVPYRVVAVPVPGLPGNALVFEKSLADQNRVLSRLGLASLLFGLGGVLVAALAGFGVGRSGLRPVQRLTSSVEEIAETEDLTTPLPVEGDDEIARLATAFNHMLTSLDASRERQRRLVTDAGHELRTPLTSLRTNVDLLTQSHHSGLSLPATARAELLDDIAGQIDELTTLIGDLTELARDEPLSPVVGTLDVSEIVDVAVARVRRRAPGATFDVETHSWQVVGEAPALERAITNLLDNAAKWSPPDGRVTVRLVDGVLTVDDEGPGIAEADRTRVFDRFWRATESRSMPGSGLGLSIVRQVAERHSGTVAAQAAPGGGARLVMRLPGAAGPADA